MEREVVVVTGPKLLVPRALTKQPLQRHWAAFYVTVYLPVLVQACTTPKSRQADKTTS
jgi:hypothetical protein